MDYLLKEIIHCPKEPMRNFLITFDGDVVLRETDIWPDGDCPKNPTAQDVVNVMKSHSLTKGDLVNDWNMDEMGITVTRIPSYDRRQLELFTHNPEEVDCATWD